MRGDHQQEPASRKSDAHHVAGKRLLPVDLHVRLHEVLMVGRPFECDPRAPSNRAVYAIAPHEVARAHHLAAPPLVLQGCHRAISRIEAGEQLYRPLDPFTQRTQFLFEDSHRIHLAQKQQEREPRIFGADVPQIDLPPLAMGQDELGARHLASRRNELVGQALPREELEGPRLQNQGARFGRSESALSMTRASIPREASSSAAMRPVGPAPTMSASVSVKRPCMRQSEA